MIRFLPLLLAVTACYSAEYRKLEVEPFDFQLPENGFPYPYLRSIEQIDVADDLIYLRGASDPKIIVIDLEGKLVNEIGAKGMGPGEFSSGILGLAISESIWGLDRNRKSIQRFHLDGRYIDSLRIASYKASPGMWISNRMSSFGESILVSADVSSGFLAFVYHHGQEPRGIGKPPFTQENSADLLRVVPAMNDTIWERDEAHFFCLFNYCPMIKKFDLDGNEIATFSLSRPELEEMFDVIVDFDADHGRPPRFIFSDFQCTKTSLFALSHGMLYQLDKDTGDLVGIFSFKYKNLEPRLKAKHMAFYSFRVTNRDVYLAHPKFFYDHDLFKASLMP